MGTPGGPQAGGAHQGEHPQGQDHPGGAPLGSKAEPRWVAYGTMEMRATQHPAKAAYCQRCGSRWDVTRPQQQGAARGPKAHAKGASLRGQEQPVPTSSRLARNGGTRPTALIRSSMLRPRHGQTAKGPPKGKGKGKGKPQPEAKGGPSWLSWPVASLPSWPPKEEHQPPEQQQQLTAILVVKKLPEDSIPESLRPFERRRPKEPGTSTSAPRSWATQRSTSKPCRQPIRQGSKHGRASPRASTPGSCTSSSSWRKRRTSWSSTRQRRNA